MTHSYYLINTLGIFISQVIKYATCNLVNKQGSYHQSLFVSNPHKKVKIINSRFESIRGRHDREIRVDF